MIYDGIISKPSLDETLKHYGVKGMKWGIRRYQNPDGTLTNKGKKRYSNITKLNDDLWLGEKQKTKLAKFLGKHNKNLKKEQNKTKDYDVISSKSKIGDLELYSVNPKTTNIVWLGIKSSERGKKRAQEIMDWVVSSQTKMGKEFLTLEVPGNSPDARHIYEKKGFVAGRKLSSDDVWDGLTKMKKKLK